MRRACAGLPYPLPWCGRPCDPWQTCPGTGPRRGTQASTPGPAACRSRPGQCPRPADTATRPEVRCTPGPHPIQAPPVASRHVWERGAQPRSTPASWKAGPGVPESPPLRRLRGRQPRAGKRAPARRKNSCSPPKAIPPTPPLYGVADWDWEIPVF